MYYLRLHTPGLLLRSAARRGTEDLFICFTEKVRETDLLFLVAQERYLIFAPLT